MDKLIAILEDDDSRATTMRHELVQRFPELKCEVFDNAPDMIAWFRQSLNTVTIMSLDHDLGANRQRGGKIFDPGTGRDVVDFLLSQNPICPVIIHTTNQFGGDGMRYALEDAHWVVKRIVPHNDLEWISKDWIEIVAREITF